MHRPLPTKAPRLGSPHQSGPIPAFGIVSNSMKRQSWISHLVLGQLLFTSASAVLLDKVDPSMAEYSEKKEPHPEMLEALEKQGVNANHFKRLLNAFRDPNKFRELADLKGVDDLIPNNNDDGATIKALNDE